MDMEGISDAIIAHTAKNTNENLKKTINSKNKKKKERTTGNPYSVKLRHRMHAQSGYVGRDTVRWWLVTNRLRNSNARTGSR